MPFLFPEKPVFFFLLSFSMMMMGMIPLMISQRSNVNRTLRFAYNLLVSAFCVLAAILQWMGILEVRNFIQIFHMIACVGFMMVLYPIFSSWKSCKNKRKIDWKMIGILILIMGIAMDGFFFYVHRTSARTIFWLLGVLIYIIVAAFSFMLNFRKQIFLNEKKEKELINSRITSMMSQIRSHMIFNVLNAISGMCKYDPEKADETIVCFARYLRANVDILDNDHLVPFRGVLSQLEDYVALEKVRFGDRICFEKCLEIEDFMMPSLILQPIVENAIRHGILPKGEPGTITLHTLNARDEIQIVLSDDGIGFDTESLLQKRESVGLKNIRLRLQYMMNGKIEVKSTKGKGTTVTIFLPINH